MRITSLAPGDEHCPAGGNRIDAGLDNGDGGGTAADGVLQDGEVDATAYLCHGAAGATGATGTTGATGPTGAPGEDGRDALVDVTSIPPGDPSCPAGGLRMDVGLDSNRDGVLSPSEVTESSVVCQPALGQASGSGCRVAPGGSGGVFWALLVAEAWVLWRRRGRRRGGTPRS